jgi:hypothetical protein
VIAQDWAQSQTACGAHAQFIAMPSVNGSAMKIINERLAELIHNNRDRDFWSEIKRIRSNKSGIIHTVDSQTDGVSIANPFANKYRDWYASVSVPYDINAMYNIQNGIKEMLVKAPSYVDSRFNLRNLKYEVTRFKAH